ncbi:hypothetical protein AVV40_gp60 [Mycobacterium phage Swirley]|uniref:Uncharacterized protein n=2 Tax=Benedictvirus TaxID=2946819 RepID=A0A076YR11_9CAUD|nr:hypothetical protein AVV40_gp60 [Mycobacterium phage Swirley]YP_010060829.1 hypothetical protein KIP50_gp58 [Mycobacterium phage Zolita]UVK64254.1 hypothetical protein SEA_SYDNAT_34 [Mycobacterium phage SydNat]UVK64340.1 hypothetical protein SEA_GHOULBOY_34 [Mycobacterium phage Ghoulboy]AIK68899.1 hypothetical protein PBI_SWIRLEY_34 [Mycobacterium phage Swirley]QDK03118.1 hypothetical protein SEA_ZOLITA_33 [Mycobacterium phage Zolita]
MAFAGTVNIKVVPTILDENQVFTEILNGIDDTGILFYSFEKDELAEAILNRLKVVTVEPA